jgi:tetratricopeptide (TPR) repeat protein
MIPDTASLWAGVRRFEDILKRDPHAYSFAPLAELYLSLGLPEDALQTARKGCALFPDFAAGQMALARAALAGALTSEAKSSLETVVRITPENLEAQRLLADIYTADGEQAAALHCLGIVSSLEAMLPEPVIPVAVTVAEPAVMEIADDDILELTDDLIEYEDFEGDAVSPFSAAPERPSLGDASHRAEPYLLETAPPLYQQEQTVTSPQPEEAEEAEAPATVASATIAELYVQQGFPERGADVYRALLQGEPDNTIWRARLAELSATVAGAESQEITAMAVNQTAKSDSTEGVLEALCGWLANIGRIRECRTKRV